MQMNFGRYKGKEMRDCPRGYLRWVYSNVDLAAEEAKEICRIIGRAYIPPAPVHVDPVSDDWETQVAELEYQELCKELSKFGI